MEKKTSENGVTLSNYALREKREDSHIADIYIYG